MQAQEPEGSYPACEVCAMAKAQEDWKLKAQSCCMTYGLLLASSTVDSYWQAGQVYVIVGRTRLREALVEMAASLLATDQPLLEAMLNPAVPGYATHVTVKRGLEGYVKITPLRDQRVPPIALGDWYKPLAQCWIAPTFSRSDYQKVLATVRENRR
jgi:hypothetical protein